MGRRPKQYSQAARLTRIIRALASRKCTVNDLAHGFAVPRRQVYRVAAIGVATLQSVEKLRIQAVQKGFRCEAHDKSTSAGVLSGYVEGRRLSATKQVSLFQQPVYV